jgi:peroxiredoxin
MTADGPVVRSTEDIFKGRRVVLFAVPGAFTPTCHRNHLPGFLAHRDEILAKGIDAIAVTAVNDVFVMENWAKSSGGAGRIEFLADGNGDFAKAIGLSRDMTAGGMGVRSQRYSMVVDDGVVQQVNVEETPGSAEVSGAARLLASL